MLSRSPAVREPISDPAAPGAVASQSRIDGGAMIRVLIADDHTLLRDGLKRTLAATAGISVVGEAASGREVLVTLGRVDVDVLLLDITMPDTDFLETLHEIRKRHPGVRVLVLSAHPESEYAELALKEGAIGYVTKDRAPTDLEEAIRRAHRGVRYISETFAQHLAARLASGSAPRDHTALSTREFQVLGSLGQGESVTEIAASLGLSPKTVSTYRQRILEKLGLKTTADIIRYAVQHGIAQ